MPALLIVIGGTAPVVFIRALGRALSTSGFGHEAQGPWMVHLQSCQGWYCDGCTSFIRGGIHVVALQYLVPVRRVGLYLASVVLMRRAVGTLVRSLHPS